ncbi:MAG: hypothetical protein AB2L21_06785 [Anaerolineaceae bacterium]|jgi:hypothetical protein
MNAETKKVPWFLWPFWLVFQLALIILKVTGRMVCVVIGLVFLIIGIGLTATQIGALLGIPLIILGIMLMVHPVF